MTTNAMIDPYDIYQGFVTAMTAANPGLTDDQINTAALVFVRKARLVATDGQRTYGLNDVALLWNISHHAAQSLVRWGVITRPGNPDAEPLMWQWTARDWTRIVAAWRILYRIEHNPVNLSATTTVTLAEAASLAYLPIRALHIGLNLTGALSTDRVITMPDLVSWARNTNGLAIYMSDGCDPEIRCRCRILPDVIIAARPDLDIAAKL